MTKNLSHQQAKLILFNKPFNVLSQFTDESRRPTLADYIDQKGVYAAGRLDRDSEGLLLLTDSGQLQHQIANPSQKVWKTYMVQVEGQVNAEAINQLQKGVELKDGMTRPARVAMINSPDWLCPRNPPVRFRKTVPDHWLQIQIQEGKNRQVRRMTAAVGLPTLRLIRQAIGNWQLGNLQPGQFITQFVTLKKETRHELDSTRHRRDRHRGRRQVSRRARRD